MRRRWRHRAPRAGRGGDAIERVDGDVEEIGVGVVLREPQNQLGDRRRAAEAIEVEADVGSRPGEIEAGEGVEIAAGLDLQLRVALDEEIERGAKTFRRAAGASGQHRSQAKVAGEELDDPRRFEIVESVKHDGFCCVRGHVRKVTRTLARVILRPTANAEMPQRTQMPQAANNTFCSLRLELSALSAAVGHLRPSLNRRNALRQELFGQAIYTQLRSGTARRPDSQRGG